MKPICAPIFSYVPQYFIMINIFNIHVCYYSDFSHVLAYPYFQYIQDDRGLVFFGFRPITDGSSARLC